MNTTTVLLKGDKDAKFQDYTYQRIGTFCVTQSQIKKLDNAMIQIYLDVNGQTLAFDCRCMQQKSLSRTDMLDEYSTQISSVRSHQLQVIYLIENGDYGFCLYNGVFKVCSSKTNGRGKTGLALAYGKKYMLDLMYRKSIHVDSFQVSSYDISHPEIQLKLENETDLLQGLHPKILSTLSISSKKRKRNVVSNNVQNKKLNVVAQPQLFEMDQQLMEEIFTYIQQEDAPSSQSSNNNISVSQSDALVENLVYPSSYSMEDLDLSLLVDGPQQQESLSDVHYV